MTDKRITLLIADDHPVVRHGPLGIFASSAGFKAVGETADSVEAVAWSPR